MARVLVAGATGAIGRPLLPMLVAAGHEVVGTTRSRDRFSLISDAGAEPAQLDGADLDGIRALVAEARPDVVVNQLTNLPDRIELRKMGESLAATGRLRSEAGPALALAAAEAGARRLISQSIAFAYAPEGERVLDESAPLRQGPDGPRDDPASAVAELERATLRTPGIEGIVLRYGYFYGPHTYFARDGSTARDVAARRYPIVGKGTGMFSFIHVDDAAAATLAAVERGPAGAYNVVDDEPAALREWLPAYAAALGARPPRRVPLWLARLVAGRTTVTAALTQSGASNARAKSELGWAPRYPSWREGFPASLG